jgi:hypothetical protein
MLADAGSAAARHDAMALKLNFNKKKNLGDR